jgi:succinate dehydrogenase / fumarate reductase cytochrome b subunit
MSTSSDTTSLLPSSFIRKRLHSLTGVFLVLFLFFHLLTNSQAALFFSDDGKGFIHDVNFIHALPYLIVIELFLLGVPFLIHMYYGVLYLWTASYQTDKSDTAPYLPYARNRAYMWQRVTAWLLLVAVAVHVVQMRMVNYATSVKVADQVYYLQPVTVDNGIYSVAARLGAQLFNAADVAAARDGTGIAAAPFSTALPMLPDANASVLEQQRQQVIAWQDALERWHLTDKERVAVTKDFGTATLLMVRDTFKSLPMAVFYTIFVIAACYHAFNGLWSAGISWGVTLGERMQQRALRLWQGVMLLTIFLGLVAIWATYWITLKT